MRTQFDTPEEMIAAIRSLNTPEAVQASHYLSMILQIRSAREAISWSNYPPFSIGQSFTWGLTPFGWRFWDAISKELASAPSPSPEVVKDFAQEDYAWELDSIIEYDEPHESGGDSRVTMTVHQAILFALQDKEKVGKYVDRNTNLSYILEDFMTSNGAWFKDAQRLD